MYKIWAGGPARGAKATGAIAGGGAFAVLAITAAVHGLSGSAGIAVAGSGDAPTNTTYVQPTVKGMQLGSTNTATTPPSAPATGAAVPSVKAGK